MPGHAALASADSAGAWKAAAMPTRGIKCWFAHARTRSKVDDLGALLFNRASHTRITQLKQSLRPLDLSAEFSRLLDQLGARRSIGLAD
jgi:hypothetical protein